MANSNRDSNNKVNWIGLRGLARGNGHWGSFPEILNQLDSKINFELLEIPGNGTRNKEVTPISVEEVVANIRSISRIVKENKKFNLLGISLGGMVGLKWAELFPQEIEKLIIVNSSLSQFSATYRRLQLRQLSGFVKAISAKDFRKRESIMLKIISNSPDKHKINLDRSVEFSTKYPIQFSNFIRQLLLAKLVRIDHTEIKAKVKVICAENDKFVHYSCSQEIAKNFGFDIEIHPTAGHDLPLDDPDWLARQLISL